MLVTCLLVAQCGVGPFAAGCSENHGMSVCASCVALGLDRGTFDEGQVRVSANEPKSVERVSGIRELRGLS